jgi:diphthamide synthase (EF-2-diphthine--ammonia ligase)
LGFKYLNVSGGEAETAVLYMPGFKKEIKLEYCVESEDNYRHFINIKKIN